MDQQVRSTSYLRLFVVILLFSFLILCNDISSADTLSFPDSLLTIEDEAFYGDSSIDEVVLPEGIKTIGESAFASSSIVSIYLPSSISSIAEHAFQSTSVIGTGLSGTYAHHWFIDHGFDFYPLTTPIEDFEWDTISGLEVKISKYIGSDAAVYIPDMIDDYDVAEIDENAFYGNTSLSTIYIPSSVKTIGSHAFQNCSNLSEIIFSEGLIDINAEAFRNCTSLSYAELPDSVEGIGEGAFQECTGLEGFHYPANLNHRNSLYDNGYLYDGNIFRDCDKLISYTIPEGITTVCEGLFYGANKLQHVFLPSTLKEIGSNAFRGCVSLQSVTIPNGVITIHEYAFASCNTISTLKMPNTIKTVESQAFMDCTSLATVVFSNQLLNIGAEAFAGCLALTTADLPDCLVGLGEYAFSNCTNLISVHYPLHLDHRNSRYNNDYLYDGRTFYNCKRLKTITIPEGVTKVVDGIFMGANYLREVNLPSTLITIENNAFAKCESIRSITIPENVASIGDNAFSDCTALRSITLPNNIVTLGAYAFKSCTSLSTVVFPDQLKKMGAGVFEECTALQNADLPDSLEGIGERCFYGCKKLNSFHYPLHLNYLIGLYGYECLYEGNIFHDCLALKTIEIPYGVTKIPGAMFAGSNYLINVTIPDTVTMIGGVGIWFSNGETFKDCVSMEKIYIGPNVTTIGDDTFVGCTNLTVWCEYGSTVLQHCKDNNVDYYYLTPDGVNNPSGTIYKGDGYSLHGYARSSLPLSNITATIWNSNKTEAVYSVTVTPGTNDYALSGTINNNMLFSKLDLGNYRYTLTASTTLSEEVWADTTITVVPPPLRVGITGFVEFSNIVFDSFVTLSGIVHANYTINSLKISLINYNKTEVFSRIVYPASKSYSLSSISLDLSSVSTDSYTIIITVSANGETKTVLQTPISVNSASSTPQASKELKDEIVEYIRSTNVGIFWPIAEADSYLANMSTWDKILMGLSDYNSLALSKFTDWLSGSDYNSYMEKKYEAEIAQIIDDMYKEGKVGKLKAYGDFGKLIKDVNGLVGDVASYELDDLNERIDNLEVAFGAPGQFEEMDALELVKDSSGIINDFYKGVKYGEDFINFLSEMLTDHSRALEALEIISETYNSQGNPEFTAALNTLKASYKSKLGKAVIAISRRIGEEVMKTTEKTITKAVLQAAGASTGSLYGLADTAAEMVIKYSGIEELGQSKIDFLTQYTSAISLQRAYENACMDALNSNNNGDQLTDRQVNRIQVSFIAARHALLRLYQTLLDLDSSHLNKYNQAILDMKHISMPGVDELDHYAGGGSR